MNTNLQNLLWCFMRNLLQNVCLVICKILQGKSVVMFAYIIDAAGYKITFLQHGDSVWYLEFI